MSLETATKMWKCYGPWEGIRSFVYFFNYYFNKRILHSKVLTRSIFEYKMYLDLNDTGISKTLALFGKRELEHRYILQKELQKGMTVLDIGANIGYYPLMEAVLVGSEGKVYAVEPSPRNYELLRENVILNRYNNIIETFNIAISNKEGEATFFLSDLSNLNTFHPELFRGKHSLSQRLSGKTIVVKTADIEKFVRDKRRIDLVRMDIEGHEVEVFESIISATLNNNFSAKILFETHFPKYDDNHHNMRVKLRKLFEVGYFPKYMASTDEKRARFKNKGYYPDKVIRTDGVERGIYRNIKKDDAIEFICDTGGVRTVFLERDK